MKKYLTFDNILIGVGLFMLTMLGYTLWRNLMVRRGGYSAKDMLKNHTVEMKGKKDTKQCKKDIKDMDKEFEDKKLKGSKVTMVCGHDKGVTAEIYPSQMRFLTGKGWKLQEPKATIH